MGQARLIDHVLESVPCDELERLLGHLIEIESHDDAPGRESDIAAFIAGWFAEHGVECCVREAEPGRPNVIAILHGTGSGSSLLFEGHTDTVPAYGMKNPFKAVKRGGRIYGRGSVDMKGALAAMMWTVVAIKRSGISLAGDLCFAATAGEESYSPGAWSLINIGDKFDYAIVGEPTNMKVGIAHKGVGWYEAEFSGVSVHGSVPEQGINAIYRANRWIQHLQDEYIPGLKRRVHPLLGSPSLNVGVIEGGTRPVIVPNRCVVRFERRLLPGETAETALIELQQTMEDVRSKYSDFDGFVRLMDNFHGVPHGPLQTPADSPLIQVLADAYQAEIGKIEEAGPIGLQFWTNAALLQQICGNTVVCGPGNIEQAHSDDEYIEVEQLYAAFRIYARSAIEICAHNGVERHG